MKGKNPHQGGTLYVMNLLRGAGREPDKVPAEQPPDALRSSPPVERIVGRHVTKTGGGGRAY